MINSKSVPESYIDIYGEYLVIEGALMFLVDGLENLSEKSEITSGDVWNCKSALTTILQQVRHTNDSLDIKIRPDCR